ncbi:hypothetical protein E1B28_009593 [Marasmius oreades]|uniref:Uncharacterized protein n=1 Tax=Marasmius oreades TaxID=181124 RepID=A0A9P7RVE9_9AGAR|nr:uncharacterized protein E1B28_009593 [Marasmius oreades]KAG7090479.1 hypothetical protein E1B28_009593 [Marasmius oreades]
MTSEDSAQRKRCSITISPGTRTSMYQNAERWKACQTLSAQPPMSSSTVTAFNNEVIVRLPIRAVAYSVARSFLGFLEPEWIAVPEERCIRRWALLQHQLPPRYPNIIKPCGIVAAMKRGELALGDLFKTLS